MPKKAYIPSRPSFYPKRVIKSSTNITPSQGPVLVPYTPPTSPPVVGAFSNAFSNAFNI